MKRLGALRPALEGPEWRSAERVDRHAAKLLCQSIDAPTAPAIKRIGQSVGGFIRCGKVVPAGPPNQPDQQKRLLACKRSVLLVWVEPDRSTRRQSSRGNRRFKFGEHAGHPPG